MLDVIEKLTRIVFTVLLGAMVSVAGLKIQWDKIGIETDALCFNHAETVKKALLVQNEVIPASLVTRYAERCNVSVEQAAQELNETKAGLEIVASAADVSALTGTAMSRPQLPGFPDIGAAIRLPANNFPAAGPEPVPEPPGTGYAAIGRITTPAYAQVNFDRMDGTPATGSGNAPAKGDRLKARWEVNLRANTTVTTSGGNPVVGLIGKDQCVDVLEPTEEFRGQIWAKVALTPC